MIRTSAANGRYAAGEDDIILGTVKSWTGEQTKGLVYSHGYGDQVVDPFRDQQALLYGLARHATVHLGSLGGNSWGNDTGIARVGQAIAELRAHWGVTGPVALVGVSMGFTPIAAYALAHPEDVSCLAGAVPLTDISDIYTRLGATYGASIDAAYPPSYNDVTQGPTHSPIRFAASLPAGLPVHIWTASNDPTVTPATSAAFVAARPQTVRTDVGALGHTDASVNAAGPGIIDFVRAHL